MPHIPARFTTPLTLVLVVTSAATLQPSPAHATSSQCAMIRSTTVGGFRWSSMPTSRTCSPTLSAGVAGLSYLVEHQVVIRYSPTRTSAREAAKATVHELSHQVEYRTTAAHRARLYSFLGIRNPSGNYFAFNDSYYYSGPLARWKQSPRERLAESVVNCRYGSPNHTGMALVPRSRCTAFLSEFTRSLAAAR